MWRIATKPINDESKSSFRGWLLTQTYRIDDVGKVARRVAEDSCLGQRVSAESVRQHTLTCHSATPSVIDGFNRATEEWQQAKDKAAGLQTRTPLPHSNTRNRESSAWSSAYAVTWNQVGRSWASVRGHLSQFGGILQPSLLTSRKAGRAGVARRTPALLTNLLSASRQPRTPASNRRSNEIRSRNPRARATRPSGGNEPSSARDRWYERVVAEK